MQTSGADGGTEASAEDDVVPISAISDTTVVKKEWNSHEVHAFIMLACGFAHLRFLRVVLAALSLTFVLCFTEV